MLENDAQSFLMDYLNNLGGFVCKIELSGKPLNGAGGKIIKLIPFKNKYYRKAMSDCLFFYRSNFYAFEFKKIDEHEKIKRQLHRFETMTVEMLPEYLHRAKDQYDFIEEIKKQGGYGGFVSTLKDLKDIIDNDRT